MKQFNPKNERIKKPYFTYQKEAKRKAETTISGIRKAILRFETYTGFKDFGTFTKEQAIGFKKHLASSMAERTGQPVSKSTMLSTINALKDFFIWLAYRPGYRSRIDIHDVEYFNLSEKDSSIARTTKLKNFPTLEQIRAVIASMPIATDMDRRNRALIAFAILTGARDGALASIKLRHVDIHNSLLRQEPDSVRTKFSKRIDTFFFPLGDDLRGIVADWVRELREQKLYGENDPLFPRTKLGQSADFSFKPVGLESAHWQTATPIREIFKSAFKNAGLPYFNPHSFRNTLVNLAEKYCKTPEEFKAWSQNLGHEQVLTTFNSYGQINPHRQGEIIAGIALKPAEDPDKIRQQIKELVAKL